MKVLFISRIYPNEFNGDGRVVDSQANELVRQGCEVKVISPVPVAPKLLRYRKSLWKEYSMLPSKEKRGEINIYRPKYVKLPNVMFGSFIHKVTELSILFTILRTIKSNLKDFKFDIVHCHMTYPDSVVVKRIKEVYKVPVIVSARSSDLDISANNPPKAKVMRNIYEHADNIIAPSLQLQDKLKERFNLKSVHIGNGTYPKKLDSALNNNLNGVYDEKYVILSVSNLIKRKGIEDNLFAICELKDHIPDILYLIIGDGPERENLRDLANKLDLKEHVKFLGKLDHEQSMNYMNICDVFSLPSKRETFGLVYLEALYFNKPIILCEKEAIAGSLQHNINAILVPNNSPKILSSNILSLYEDPEYRRSLSSNGKEIVTKNYTWEVIGYKLLALYNQALEDKYNYSI